MTTNTAVAIGSVAVAWTATDVAADGRIAVVIIDQTGELSAQQSGAGAVSGSGTDKLILNGNSADIAAELASLIVVEPVAEPDCVDIEAFGVDGRLADAQISLLALTVPTVGAIRFVPSSPAQYWIAAVASINAGSITSLSYTWNRPSPETGQYQVIQTVAIHEPLAEDGVVMVGGVPRQPAASPSPGSSSLPLNMAGFNPNAYNPYSHLSTVNVLSTTVTYGGVSRKEQTVTRYGRNLRSRLSRSRGRGDGSNFQKV